MGLVFMGRSDGVPVNRNTHRILDGSASTDDLDVGVGVFGTDAQSSLAARMAIYQYQEGRLEFRYVINFDLKTGMPMKRLPPGGGAPRALLEADRAMCNWMRPLLFDDNVKSGGYRWKTAPRVPLAQLDPEERREADADKEFGHPRWFYSQERKTSSAFSMFQDNLVMDHIIDQMAMPEVQKLIIPVGGGIQGPDSIEIPAKMLRRICVQRFLSGLYSRSGGYFDLKDAILRALSTIDRMLLDSSNPIANMSASRYAETMLASAEDHLKSVRVPSTLVSTCMESIISAVNLIKIYTSISGSCAHALVVPSDKVVPSGAAVMTVIRPELSVQVLDGVPVESFFPKDGSELFKK
jgi:hypothetical protein